MALFTVSFSQALPRRRSILLALLELVPATIYLFATNSRTEIAALDGLIQIGATTFLALVLPVVTIVVASGTLGNERRDLTLSFIVLRPISRFAIAFTKTAAVVTAAFTLNAIGALALSLSHLFRYGDPAGIAGFLGAALIATIAYAAVFVPLGFLTDRAVIIGMAYLLVFENGVIFALAGMSFLSPWRLGAAVLSGLVEGAPIELDDLTGSMSMTSALLAATAYVVVSLALTTVLLKRRDLA